MPHIDKLDRPIRIVLPGLDWAMIAGLLIQEHKAVVDDPNRQAYAKHLLEVRQEIFRQEGN